jgi:peptide-methionine (S)-S-oxide reductase
MTLLQSARRFTLVFAAAAATAWGLAGTAQAQQAAAAGGNKLATAIFASGCFWCSQADFSKAEGVVSTTAGYTGGTAENPTYEQVSTQATGHTEAVLVVYDPAKTSYERLLTFFWHTIDPTSRNRQFCDSGSMHRAAIFAQGADQMKAALASRKALEDSKFFSKPIATEIEPAGEFYAAEAYHQNYFKRNPLRYRFFRFNCGRDSKLKELWGDLAVRETAPAQASAASAPTASAPAMAPASAASR